MGSLISWVVLLSFLGAIVGGLYWRSLQGAAGGILVAVIAAIVVWVRHLAVIFHPDSFVEYNNTTPGITPANGDKVVLSLTVIDDKGYRTSKEIHGLTLDEWRQLGAGVVKYNFEYSSRKLQTIFKPSRGATIYEIITPKLKDRYIGVLMDDGNGVAVTQGRGEKFFEQLAKGDYEILRVLDTPPSPAPARDIA